MSDTLSQTFLEDFDRLSGVQKREVKTEDVDELKASIVRTFEMHAHRRNLIQRDLAEIALSAAESARFGHLTENQEGVQIIAKVVGELVSEMVGESLMEYTKIRRRR